MWRTAVDSDVQVLLAHTWDLHVNFKVLVRLDNVDLGRDVHESLERAGEGFAEEIERLLEHVRAINGRVERVHEREIRPIEVPHRPIETITTSTATTL